MSASPVSSIIWHPGPCWALTKPFTSGCSSTSTLKPPMIIFLSFSMVLQPYTKSRALTTPPPPSVVTWYVTLMSFEIVLIVFDCVRVSFQLVRLSVSFEKRDHCILMIRSKTLGFLLGNSACNSWLVSCQHVIAVTEVDEPFKRILESCTWSVE